MANRYALQRLDAASPFVSPNQIEFFADSYVHAQTLAQSVSTLFALSLRLVPLAPSTDAAVAYTPGSQGSTVSSPTGITAS